MKASLRKIRIGAATLVLGATVVVPAVLATAGTAQAAAPTGVVVVKTAPGTVMSPLICHRDCI